MMRLSLLGALLLLAACPRPEGPTQSPKATVLDGDIAGKAATPGPVPVTQLPPEAADLGTKPGPVAPGVAPEALSPTVKLRLASSPKASVRWGKKTLGVTPLTFERPRDSGPVDLVFVAKGYFPVHTRAFSFKHDSVHVKMTKLADRNKLYGAKKEPTAPTAPSCDPMAGPCPPPPAPAPGPAAPPAPAPAPSQPATPPK